MVKKLVCMIALFCTVAVQADAQSLKDILSGVVGQVVGDKATTATSIIGTWNYVSPDCQLKGDDLLKNISGDAAGSEVEKKMGPIYEKAGFAVIRTSAETGDGVEELRALIQGKLTAFTGNSGVGKSSILNRLAPELNLATGEVSEKLGRGRHTTRHVDLYCLGEDTYVADTPGFSSFDTDQMEVILKENLQYSFPDFGAYVGKCRFDDCSHRKEPDCAVRAAVESGDIGKSRYDSYLRLYENYSQVKLWELKK